jgi:hypothetical protein
MRILKCDLNVDEKEYDKINLQIKSQAIKQIGFMTYEEVTDKVCGPVFTNGKYLVALSFVEGIFLVLHLDKMRAFYTKSGLIRRLVTRPCH